MQCRTRTALELSRTMRSADDRYYYETPKFDTAHAECEIVAGLPQSLLYWQFTDV